MLNNPLPFRTRIKVCCISSKEEADIAVSHGADAIGLVGNMPSGPGIISDDLARDIALSTSPPVSSFLLTSETSAKNIADHVRHVKPTTVQIVNHIDPSESRRLAELIPEFKRVQVIHVEDDDCLAMEAVYADYNHAFLLDSGKPGARVPELGGTGRTHDWDLSRQFVSHSRLPVFLAGGLKPENVADAIHHVRPYGIDLCSGVRTNDQLDEAKLAAFMQQVRQADDKELSSDRSQSGYGQANENL